MALADFLSQFLLMWIGFIVFTPNCFAIPCGRSLCSDKGNCELVTSVTPPVKRCICDAGWSGDICDSPVMVTGSDTSTSHPSTTPSVDSSTCKNHSLVCNNGGTCHVVQQRGKYLPVCQCTEGWAGKTCATECKMRCYNNGKCEERRATGKVWIECDCITGYSGKSCEYPCIKCGVYTCRLSNGHPTCATTTSFQTTTMMTATQSTTPVTHVDVSTTYEISTTNAPAASTDIPTMTNTGTTETKSTPLSTTYEISTTNAPVASTAIPTMTNRGTAETKSTPLPQNVTSSRTTMFNGKSGAGADSVVYMMLRLSVISINCYIMTLLIAFA